jgi:predicted O-methyltransferase YrrM
MNDKPVFSAEPVERIRSECRKSREIITKTDFGETGSDGNGKKYAVSIRSIAKTSLTAPRKARRLFRLAQFLKAGRIIEMGTSLGLTAAYLALSRPEARIITLEGCPELCRKAREQFKRLDINNIEVIEGRFEDTLPGALDKLGSTDLVYFDGNHRPDAVVEYYKYCFKHSVNDTVMVFDDIRRSREMEKAWEMIRQREEIVVSLDFFFSGWVLFRKESSREHFNLRYV